jgi:hypothetical protein
MSRRAAPKANIRSAQHEGFPMSKTVRAMEASQ